MQCTFTGTHTCSYLPPSSVFSLRRASGLARGSSVGSELPVLRFPSVSQRKHKQERLRRTAWPQRKSLPQPHENQLQNQQNRPGWFSICVYFSVSVSMSVCYGPAFPLSGSHRRKRVKQNLEIHPAQATWVLEFNMMEHVLWCLSVNVNLIFEYQ